MKQNKVDVHHKILEIEEVLRGTGMGVLMLPFTMVYIQFERGW